MLTNLTVLEQLQTGKQLRSKRYVCAWKCPYAHNPSLGRFLNVAFETVHTSLDWQLPFLFIYRKIVERFLFVLIP